MQANLNIGKQSRGLYKYQSKNLRNFNNVKLIIQMVKHSMHGEVKEKKAKPCKQN